MTGRMRTRPGAAVSLCIRGSAERAKPAVCVTEQDALTVPVGRVLHVPLDSLQPARARETPKRPGPVKALSL